MDFESAEQLVFLIFRVLAYVGLTVYTIFSLVIVKQVRLMTDTLKFGFEKGIKTIAMMHFIFALVVFVVAILVL